jgi:hypothetical protein
MSFFSARHLHQDYQGQHPWIDPRTFVEGYPRPIGDSCHASRKGLWREHLRGRPPKIDGKNMNCIRSTVQRFTPNMYIETYYTE